MSHYHEAFERDRQERLAKRLAFVQEAGLESLNKLEEARAELNKLNRALDDDAYHHLVQKLLELQLLVTFYTRSKPRVRT